MLVIVQQFIGLLFLHIFDCVSSAAAAGTSHQCKSNCLLYIAYYYSSNLCIYCISSLDPMDITHNMLILAVYMLASINFQVESC